MRDTAAAKTVFRVTWRLLAICLAVAALTAAVFAVTKGPIESGEKSRKEEAMRLFFPALASYEEETCDAAGVNALYRVTDKDGKALGWCVDFSGNSDYGGEVAMMIGVTPEGNVSGLQVISHSETFIDRYLDKDGCYTGVSAAWGSDLSAGATLSYNAIRGAMEAVENLQLGGAR